MDKIGIIITARMTSERLRNKIFAQFRGKRIIDHVIDNAKKLGYPVILSIPEKSDNDELEIYCKINHITYYRGFEYDVLSRVLNTARKYNIDIIIKLGADSPLTEPDDIMDNIVKFLDENKRRMIWGMNSFIFTTDMLEEVEKNSTHADDREHTGFHYMTNTIDYQDDIDRLE